MINFRPIDGNMISIGDLTTQQMRDVSENIVSLDVSLTMDGASEIEVEIVDPEFKYANANYFQVRRDVFYGDMIFEIAAVEVQRSESTDPLYRLSCRNKNVQMMKRDKKPEAYRATSASDYAQLIADRFKMIPFIEKTTKKQSIVKGRSSQSDESVWDVLQRSAQEAKFVCFETNNILFFCSERFLVGKWGDPRYKEENLSFIPFGWPDANEKDFPGASKRYLLLDMPNFRQSDDNVYQAEGSLIVDRINGRLIRPGMTVWVGGIPDFEQGYLVTEVQFSEGVPDPVRLSLRTPPKATDDEDKGRGKGGGGNQNVPLPASIANKIRDYIHRNYGGGQRRTADTWERTMKTLGDTTVKAANEIYNAKSLEDKQKIYAKYLALWGAKDIKYKALLSVRRELLGTRFAATATFTIPASVTSKITAYVSLREPPGSRRNSLIAQARKDAGQIYFATTKARQDQLFDQFERQYGAADIRYLVIEHVRPLIAKINYPSLDANFPVII